jgi:hypothetical protein
MEKRLLVLSGHEENHRYYLPCERECILGHNSDHLVCQYRYDCLASLGRYKTCPVYVTLNKVWSFRVFLNEKPRKTVCLLHKYA